jgi:hypothetical protein
MYINYKMDTQPILPKDCNSSEFSQLNNTIPPSDQDMKDTQKESCCENCLKCCCDCFSTSMDCCLPFAFICCLLGQSK